MLEQSYEDGPLLLAPCGKNFPLFNCNNKYKQEIKIRNKKITYPCGCVEKNNLIYKICDNPSYKKPSIRLRINAWCETKCVQFIHKVNALRVKPNKWEEFKFKLISKIEWYTRPTKQ